MSDKIGVGDWVIRNRGTSLHRGLEHGVEYEVIGVDGLGLDLRGLDRGHTQFSYPNFTKVDRPKRRKQYKEIIAWANGEEIECFAECYKVWGRVIGQPAWESEVQYRVKYKEDPRKVELAGIIKSLKSQLDEATEEYDTYE